MDSQLVVMGGLSFCFFILANLLLFRMTPREAAVIWMIRAFVGIGLGHAFYLAQFWGPGMLFWWASIYILLTVLFVFGVFGVMEASLTLRILSEIAHTGKKGITHKQLLQRYNRDVIVKRRLARLVYSGELMYANGAYKRNKVSYYMVREIFLDFLRWCFPS